MFYTGSHARIDLSRETGGIDMGEKVALIAGATGLVGKELLEILLQSNNYSHIIALVRRDLDVQHKKLTVKKVDFNQLHGELDGVVVDDVFCCLGTTIKKAKSQEKMYEVDVDYPLTLAHLLLEQGAKQFLVISSMNADSKSLFFYPRMKGEMENKLKEMPYDSISILQPSLLLGQREESRLGESVAAFVAKRIPFIFKGRLKKYKPIQAKSVALAMYKIAQKNREGKNTYFSDQLDIYGS